MDLNWLTLTKWQHLHAVLQTGCVIGLSWQPIVIGPAGTVQPDEAICLRSSHIGSLVIQKQSLGNGPLRCEEWRPPTFCCNIRTSKYLSPPTHVRVYPPFCLSIRFISSLWMNRLVMEARWPPGKCSWQKNWNAGSGDIAHITGYYWRTTLLLHAALLR